jgi:hypothetical protein
MLELKTEVKDEVKSKSRAAILFDRVSGVCDARGQLKFSLSDCMIEPREEKLLLAERA